MPHVACLPFRPALATRRYALRAVARALAASLALASPARAHLDPPGPPPLHVSVTLHSLTFDFDTDYGELFDNSTELKVFYSVWHEGHGYRSGLIEDSFACDFLPCTWTPPSGTEVLYTHEECTPMNELRVSIRLLDDDTDMWTEIAEHLREAVEFAEQFAPPDYSYALQAISVLLLAITLNADDPLGSFSSRPATGERDSVVVPVPGWGSTGIAYTAGAAPVPGDGCDSKTGIPPHDPIDPNDRPEIEQHYDAWAQGIWDSQFLQVIEPGNPGNITPSQLDEDRNTVRNFIWEAMDRLTEEVVGRLTTYTEAHQQASAALATARTYPREPQYGSSAMQHYRQAGLLAFDTLATKPTTSVPAMRAPAATLAMPRPNPGAGHVQLAWSLEPGRVGRLVLVDVAGRRTVLAEGLVGAGVHVLRRPGLAPGVYRVNLESGAERVVRTFVWLGERTPD